MHRLDRAGRAIPAIIGAITLATVAVLFAWDAFPARFPPRAHDVLGALPLGPDRPGLSRVPGHPPPRAARTRKGDHAGGCLPLLGGEPALADIPLATLFNDIAIALFVLDVFLVIIGWPAGIPDESFAETFPNRNEPSAPEAGHRGH